MLENDRKSVVQKAFPKECFQLVHVMSTNKQNVPRPGRAFTNKYLYDFSWQNEILEKELLSFAG